MANAQSPILEVRNIVKRFPGVVALNDVSVQFYPGEVHAIVGENGAGKSTLMKILAGAYIADEGEILFQGQSISYNHPREAQEAGISIIYQEFNLLPERTVAQNIFLGREPSRYGLIDRRQLRRQTIEVLQQVGAEGILSPDAEVKTLSIAEQQLVEIAKALSYDSKVLIMDEPTAALAIHEVDILTKLIHKLVDAGMAIIFISHRFTEVFDIAKSITVLKDGEHVATVPAQGTTPSEVITMMVGRTLDQYFPDLAAPQDVGEVALEVVNGRNAKLEEINLSLRKGEIVGIAGLQGSGRTELAQAIFGVEPFTAGKVIVKGTETPIKSPNDAINARMGFVTEDRKAEGIFPNQPLNDNILAPVRALQSMLRRIKRMGTAEKPDLVPALVQQVDVRTPSIMQEVQYLSGGNQQKVVLAKWLASTCDIFIFDEPTRGIDVDAKASIHEMVRDLAKAGAAVLMISSELPEIIGMSDRIVVMWDGRISGELPAASSEQEIMLLATGQYDGKSGSNQRPATNPAVNATDEKEPIL